MTDDRRVPDSTALPAAADHGEVGELPDLVALEALAVDVAREAADLITRERPDDLGVAHTKSSRTDVVTVMDQRAQDLLLARIGKLRPDDAIMGEEKGAVRGSSGLTWVIDPIDGTTNYLYGLPVYAVSVAVVTGDPSVGGRWRPVAGAVVNAASGETYRAHLRGGARVERPGSDPRSLSVTGSDDLGTALVATGFAYGSDMRARQADLLRDLLPRIRDIRRLGSAALDLCRLAHGEVDAYYESELNAWDLAAGWLVATEAGCLVSGPEVGSDPSRELLWAASPALAERFGAVIRELAARHTAS